MDHEDQDPRPLTQKERRKKYQEALKASPAYQKQKADQKQRRRQVYQAHKAKLKAQAKEQKDAQRAQKIEAQEERDRSLSRLLTPATEAPPPLKLVYSRDQRGSSK